MKDLVKAKTTLAEGGYTCVLCRGDAVYTSRDRGVAPLIGWYESGAVESGFSAADKVVGNAAAYLYVLMGAVRVHALTISESALKTLTENSIETSWENLVPAIKNRAGDGFCPMETAVRNAESPRHALELVKETLARLKNGK
ncbi:MAG: DUF1893 domain-containing protein [Oscillospiraceae bacterium]|nr:DUF1893 domain-containing protein [Oscillospiraceae bacterium]